MPLVSHLFGVAFRYSMAAISNPRLSIDSGSSDGSNPPEHARARSPTRTSLADANLEVQVESLKATLEERTREIDSLRVREKELRNEASNLESQLLYTRKTAEGRQEELAKMVNELKTRLAEAELHARRSHERTAGLERALAAAQGERRNNSVLLETRTAELREAQAYLTRVDDVTDRDVLRTVENLNSTIFQTAAKASDAFQARYHHDQHSVEAEEAGRRLVEGWELSTRLRAALRSVNHNDDSVLVQMALQGVMVSYTRRLCTTWNFGVGRDFENVYEQMRKQEPQSVSGRWRAMSRTHLKAFLGDEQERQSRGEVELAEKLTDILLICGVSGTRQRLLTEVTSVFSESLHEIVRLALHFQRVTGESIVSRDLSAVVAKPGRSFDPERMVDEWADPKRLHRVIQSPSVLCTTQLGLLRQESQPGTTSGGAGGTSLVVSSTLLLKPRVVLVTMLDDL